MGCIDGDEVRYGCDRGSHEGAQRLWGGMAGKDADVDVDVDIGVDVDEDVEVEVEVEVEERERERDREWAQI